MLQPLTRRPPGVALFSLAVLLVLPLAGCGEATDAAKSAANKAADTAQTAAANAKAAAGNAVNGAKDAAGNAVNGAKDAAGAVAGAVSGDAATNAKLYTDVKASLTSDSAVSADTIKVYVKNGAPTLVGTQPTQAAADAALADAKKTPNVGAVTSQITVKP